MVHRTSCWRNSRFSQSQSGDSGNAHPGSLIQNTDYIIYDKYLWILTSLAQPTSVAELIQKWVLMEMLSLKIFKFVIHFLLEKFQNKKSQHPWSSLQGSLSPLLSHCHDSLYLLWVVRHFVHWDQEDIFLYLRLCVSEAGVSSMHPAPVRAFVAIVAVFFPLGNLSPPPFLLLPSPISSSAKKIRQGLQI